MATTTRSITTSAFPEKSSRQKQARTDIWTSLLKQTRVAQSRNRSNAVVNRHIIVCGGTSEDQRTFLTAITRPPPPQTIRKRGDGTQQKEPGVLLLSNKYAYGYGHVSLYSAQQNGVISSTFGRDSEEVARLECHCILEADAAYENVLRRLLVPRQGQEDTLLDDEENESTEAPKQPAVTILLSWKQPWHFLSKLRAWLQLLARATKPLDELSIHDDPIELLKESGLHINVVIQHVETQEDLKKEGWDEERFDKVCQTVRTAILPLHPNSTLSYMPSIAQPQQSFAPLSEMAKVIYSSLDLDLSSFSPRPTSSSGTSTTGPAKKEELLPKHNIVDRMNIIIPAGWDTSSKIRMMTEDFSPEDVLSSWTYDLSQGMFLLNTQHLQAIKEEPSTPQISSRQQHEEVFTADASSPIEPDSSLPPSPSKSQPSAIRTYESQIVDPNAHKAPEPPTITVVTRPEQEFLREMKTELDSYVAQDRARSAQEGSNSGSASTGGRIIGLPNGESTGALDGLGDVSFNVGGVSYNTVSAEAAIERLKRPQLQQLGSDSPRPGNVSSPSTAGSRNTTPRPPRRHDGERGTPGVSTPGSSAKEFPAEDLDKFFKSLAKKAESGTASRGGTPSRQT